MEKELEEQAVIKKTPLKLILNQTSLTWGVRESDILSDRHQFVKPRFCAYLLCRELTPYSFPRIARFFQKHHTTIMYGCKRAEKCLSVDENFKQRYSLCDKAIRIFFGEP